MRSLRIPSTFSVLLLTLCLAGEALGDPCGMVPPVYTGPGVPIARTGDQNTYVFYKNGVETFVIHPAFKGKVEQFGMLIPFPKVPELRKVSDNIFTHIRKAVDPPEVVVYAGRRFLPRAAARGRAGGANRRLKARKSAPKDEVRVVKEEAVGMYEVAVLEAGSAKALNKWMDDHGYKYPRGMDAACNDYVKLGWCFVAVKTKVGVKSLVDPKPGQRNVKASLPKGGSFDGNVQAMGFRFKTDKLVVPMRLSTFNDGDLHNIVYVLSDGPMKIASIPEEYVVRQVPGEKLYKNVTQPLPLRVVGGTFKQVGAWQKRNLAQRRNPVPHNGAARDLFASDLLAVKTGQLSHPHEEKEKMLLRIGERLNLRGGDIDALNEAALADKRGRIVSKALADVKGMTLSVIDGNFPREVLANQNLTFKSFKMASRRNSPRFYDANTKKPAGRKQGIKYEGKLSAVDQPAADTRTASNDTQHGLPTGSTFALLAMTLVGMVFFTRCRVASRR